MKTFSICFNKLNQGGYTVIVAAPNAGEAVKKVMEKYPMADIYQLQATNNGYEVLV